MKQKTLEKKKWLLLTIVFHFFLRASGCCRVVDGGALFYLIWVFRKANVKKQAHVDEKGNNDKQKNRAKRTNIRKKKRTQQKHKRTTSEQRKQWDSSIVIHTALSAGYLILCTIRKKIRKNERKFAVLQLVAVSCSFSAKKIDGLCYWSTLNNIIISKRVCNTPVAPVG